MGCCLLSTGTEIVKTQLVKHPFSRERESLSQNIGTVLHVNRAKTTLDRIQTCWSCFSKLVLVGHKVPRDKIKMSQKWREVGFISM